MSIDNRSLPVVITGVLTTVAVNPWTAFDPINLPKMLVLATASAYLFPMYLTELKTLLQRDALLLLLSLLSIIFMTISFVTNSEVLWQQQLWGTWGRSTGLLTYFSLILIMLVSRSISSLTTRKVFRIYFERLGYFISGYSLVQIMEIDPINWSQKTMVTTLGNINFTSSILGFAAVSYIARVMENKLNLFSKTFYFSIFLVNIFLILYSESIQGIAVILAGFSIAFVLRIRLKKGIFAAFTLLLGCLVVGAFLILGTAGVGPLRTLEQQTVLFRMDYWKAGIRMGADNPFNGVGIDSYGDFYREYRDLEAVVRTGPQRITNTAHNIFIDLFSGAGLIVLVLVVAIMTLALFRIFKLLKLGIDDADAIAISSIWIGFMVFCMISINQIGVGVWGFIFTGLVLGYASYDQKPLTKTNTNWIYHRRHPRKLDKVTSTAGENYGGVKPNGLLSVLLAFISFAIAVIPNLADARFLANIKSNPTGAIKVSRSLGLQTYHQEFLISRVRESGDLDMSLNLARKLTQDDPRSWAGWVEIATNNVSDKGERIAAIKKLISLDPNNKALLSDLSALQELYNE